MSDERLRECPFCGSQLEMLINNPWLLYQHPENDCLLSKLVVRGTDIEKWNTRKPMERIVEKLEKYKDAFADAYLKEENKGKRIVYLSYIDAYTDIINMVKGGGMDE